MTARLLKYGARGDDVGELQDALNKLGYGLEIDGKFGRETLSSVNHFQSWWGLGVDGVVGPATRAALEQALGGGKPATRTKTGSPDSWVLTEWYLVELPEEDEYDDEDEDEDEDEEDDEEEDGEEEDEDEEEDGEEEDGEEEDGEEEDGEEEDGEEDADEGGDDAEDAGGDEAEDAGGDDE